MGNAEELEKVWSRRRTVYLKDITFEICEWTKIIGCSNRYLQILCVLIKINAFYDVFLVTNKWREPWAGIFMLKLNEMSFDMAIYIFH